MIHLDIETSSRCIFSKFSLSGWELPRFVSHNQDIMEIDSDHIIDTNQWSNQYPSTGKRHDPGKELCQTGRLTFLHFGLFIPLVLKYIIISPRMSWSLFWFLSFREQVVLNHCFPRTTSPQDNNSVEVQNKVRTYSSSSRLRMQAALHFLKPFTIEEPKIGNSYRKYVQPHNL